MANPNEFEERFEKYDEGDTSLVEGRRTTNRVGNYGLAVNVDVTEELVQDLEKYTKLIDENIDNIYKILKVDLKESWSGEVYEAFIKKCDFYRPSLDELVELLQAFTNMFGNLIGEEHVLCENVSTILNFGVPGGNAPKTYNADDSSDDGLDPKIEDPVVEYDFTKDMTTWTKSDYLNFIEMKEKGQQVELPPNVKDITYKETGREDYYYEIKFKTAGKVDDLYFVESIRTYSNGDVSYIKTDGTSILYNADGTEHKIDQDGNVIRTNEPTLFRSPYMLKD